MAHLSRAALASLKLTQLQRLAIATGTPHSGATKSALATRLLDALLPQPPKPKLKLRQDDSDPHRILSVDMGIRNLAHCTLVLPPNKGLPTLVSWARLSVSSNDHGGDEKEKESFKPPVLARLANDLVRRLVVAGAGGGAVGLEPRPPAPAPAPAPATVLIERQRFRSGGGAAVLEWTLRVNVFEAMLWAVLASVKREGVWEGDVWPVEPGRVARFWIGDEDPAGVGKGKGKGKGIKKLKIDLVGKWLESGEMLCVEGEEAEDMRRRYLLRWKGARLKGDDAAIGKLDDLADCLLQGMAWIRWEQNRRVIVESEKGVDEVLSLFI